MDKERMQQLMENETQENLIKMIDDLENELVDKTVRYRTVVEELEKKCARAQQMAKIYDSCAQDFQNLLLQTGEAFQTAIDILANKGVQEHGN